MTSEAFLSAGKDRLRYPKVEVVVLAGLDLVCGNSNQAQVQVPISLIARGARHILLSSSPRRRFPAVGIEGEGRAQGPNTTERDFPGQQGRTTGHQGISPVDIAGAEILVVVCIVSDVGLRIVILRRSQRVGNRSHVPVAEALVESQEKCLVFSLPDRCVLQDLGERWDRPIPIYREVEVLDPPIPQDVLINTVGDDREIRSELMRIACRELLRVRVPEAGGKNGHSGRCSGTEVGGAQAAVRIRIAGIGDGDVADLVVLLLALVQLRLDVVVVNPVSGTHNVVAMAERIPGESESRTEVQLGPAFAGIALERNRRLVVRRVQRSHERGSILAVVAQTKAQAQPRTDLPVVLSEQPQLRGGQVGYDRWNRGRVENWIRKRGNRCRIIGIEVLVGIKGKGALRGSKPSCRRREHRSGHRPS